MENLKKDTYKSLLRRFTDYSDFQIEDILKILEIAKDAYLLDESHQIWNDQNISRNLSLFQNYFSYRNLKATDETLGAEIEPSNSGTLLLFYLALFEYSIANKAGNMGQNVYQSATIRAKNILPEVLSFKGYILNKYFCEGDYSRYTDYLFFGIGNTKKNSSKEDVIFFRATRNQIVGFFNINEPPEVGSYLDFSNHFGRFTVNEKAFRKAITSKTEKGFLIPKSHTRRGRKF